MQKFCTVLYPKPHLFCYNTFYFDELQDRLDALERHATSRLWPQVPREHLCTPLGFTHTKGKFLLSESRDLSSSIAT